VMRGRRMVCRGQGLGSHYQRKAMASGTASATVEVTIERQLRARPGTRSF
jgi:hypothetical protein